MSSLLNIGVSGLRANQTALNVVGQNITNASTPGYARQRVNLSAQVGSTSLGFAQGAGARVDSITRIADRFVQTQIIRDTSNLAQFEAFGTRIGQLEGTLFSEEFGLDRQLQEFFAAVQNASTTPADSAARQFVLAQGQALGARFGAIGERLALQGEEVDSALRSATTQINQIAVALADLNARITQLQGDTSTAANNALLDSREVLLQELASLVEVDALEQEDGSVSVFLGKGQALVLGENIAQLEVSAGGEITLQAAGTATQQVITSSLTDGQIGGLIAFRDEVLATSANDLGRLAMNIAVQFNAQHRLGVDLNGEFGGDFFTGPNDGDLVGQRVGYLSANGVNAGSVNVWIDDIGATLPSDYELRFSSTTQDAFSIVRRSDAEIVASGTLAASSTQIEFDGLRVDIEGMDFTPGSRLLLSPFAGFIQQMQVVASDTSRLALAAPIALSQDPGNSGDAAFSLAQILDRQHPGFALDGELVPPLVIEFVTPTRYRILDNSDPAAPVPLQPDLGLLSYVPGQVNHLLPQTSNSTVTVSDGPMAGALVGDASRVSDFTPAVNSNLGGRIQVALGADATVQGAAAQTLDIPPGASARAVAQFLGTAVGVEANASTTLTLEDLQVIEAGVPVELAVNGIVLTEFEDLATLADLINDHQSLADAGIVAQSDGNTLTLTSVFGDDLNLHFQGDPNDRVMVRDQKGATQMLNGSVAGEFATVAVFGEVTAVLEPGVGMTSTVDGLFAGTPTLQRADLGVDITLAGSVARGDRFHVMFNTGGGEDNRNALALAQLAEGNFVGQPAQTFAQSYAGLIQNVGSTAAQANISAQAAQSVLEQSRSYRESISGVNLDEEAANLLRYEQAYNASAQVITVARDVLNILLNAIS